MEMSDDVHDEVAAEAVAGEWEQGDPGLRDFYVPDDPQAMMTMAVEIMADVERLLYRMVMTPEGVVWMQRQGWAWVDDHHKMQPEPDTWLMSRKFGGRQLRYVATEVLKKPKWLRHVDAVKQSAVDLLEEQPEVVCMMCVWVSSFHADDAEWCNRLSGRLARLDVRLDPTQDWLLDAALIFGTISNEVEEEAKAKLEAAEVAAQEAKETLEQIVKPKFV